MKDFSPQYFSVLLILPFKNLKHKFNCDYDTIDQYALAITKTFLGGWPFVHM